MRLKSHESPRRQGRNAKGKGGTARKRQLDKRFKTTVQRLKGKGNDPSSPPSFQSPFSSPEQVPHLLFSLSGLTKSLNQAHLLPLASSSGKLKSTPA